MFYYPAVLRRHTGCFSTIWLVATKGIRVTRRDFLKVNVTKTCDDIMDYLLERVEPPRADLPRPRFSLYLSSQLQYGVILVYHRQCAILLEETQYVVDWLLKQKTTQKNDMDDHLRPAPLLKDVLSLMEETEGAPDPLFGQMYMKEDLPSPRALLQGHLRDKSPPYHPPRDLPEAAPSSPAEEELHRASQETITLREPEPLPVPFTEFEGMELVDHPDTINLLLAETDQFLEGESPRDEPGLERGESERDHTREQTEPSAELQPTVTQLSEDQVVSPQDLPHLQPLAPPVDQLTPVSAPVVPSPPSAADRGQRRSAERESSPEEEVQRRRWRRRRQLIFMDEDTQLSQEEQQQQISDPRTQTAPASILPRRTVLPATHLLNTPVTSLLAEELLLLWRRAAVITSVPGSDLQVGERGPESTDSEERESTEGAELQRQEESSKEIPRDEAEAEQLDVSVDAVTLLQLEGSDHMEGSREISPMFTPHKEGSVVSGSILQDIPEEITDAGGRPVQRSPELCSKSTSQEQPVDFLCRFLPGLLEREEGPSSFQSLLPRGASRRTVSRHFVKLLEDLTSRKLRAEQTEPYDDIFLSVISGSPRV